MIEVMFLVVVIAFLLGFFDISLGMGYGTTIVPVLIIMGFAPLEVVPVVLITNAVMGIVAGALHHNFDNVDFSLRSKDFKIMSYLTGFGIIGMALAVLVAINISELFLDAYIAILVLIIGLVVLLNHKKRQKFSWKKLIGLGSFAAFNKGMTGGGYGSMIVGGQILIGIDGKRAVGIATLAEGLICLIGATIYLSINGYIHLNTTLMLSLLMGGLLAIPIAVQVVRKFHRRRIKFIIGLVNIILGLAMLAKIFFL